MYFLYMVSRVTNTHVLKQKAKHKTHDRTLQTTSTCCIVYHIQIILFYDADFDLKQASGRFETSHVSLFQHDTLCKAWSFFFLLCWNPHLEHAISWGPSVSRPDYFPPSQSQLLRHQRKEETQSASALHLYSCDRYINMSVRISAYLEWSTVPTQG